VVADKDESGTGERVAVQTGFPYFLPAVGDFNDLHKAEGTFRASQALRKWIANEQFIANGIANAIANGSPITLGSS
jgi:hypothetical protein